MMITFNFEESIGATERDAFSHRQPYASFRTALTLTGYLELDSVTLEDLLLSFGSPAELSVRAEEGRERMRRVSRGKLAASMIEAVLESARQTIGVPCVAAEREYLMALGAELRHSREQKERVGLRLSALTQADPELHALGVTLGRVTTGLLIAEGLDPRAYANSGSYCKAFGLNLKERSSGQHKGQIKITNGAQGRLDAISIEVPDTVIDLLEPLLTLTQSRFQRMPPLKLT